MPNWSIYRRRGGRRFAGTAAPPGAADWSLSVISNSEIDILFPVQIPSPANQIFWRRRPSTSAAWTHNGVGSTSPIQMTGLTPNASYDVQIFWALGGGTLSEGSDIKSASTPV